MAPPLLTLQDIHLTFGGTPLLEGAELAIGERERVCLVGRNGSGKSTLLKIAAGTVEADRGARFRAARRHDPLSGAGAGPLRLRHGARLCGGGPRAGRRSASRALSAGTARPDRRRRPGAPVRRRGAPRRARARAGARARHPAARRADQPSRPAGDRMARKRAGVIALRAGADQPRPALPRKALARDGVARPRRDAAHRARLCVVRGMARPGAGGRRARAAQARPQDRRRGALDALRRHRAAQAQHAPRRAAGGDAQGFPRASRRDRRGEDRGERGRAVGQARRRGGAHLQKLRRDRSCATFRSASSAATASAWSARTARARPRC